MSAHVRSSNPGDTRHVGLRKGAVALIAGLSVVAGPFGPGAVGPLDAAGKPSTPSIRASAVTPVAAALPGDVVADFSDVRQPIDGFGASDRKNPLLTDAQADLLFSPSRGIGLSILRASMDPNGSYLNGYDANASKAAARGATVWMAPWTPPAAWKDNGDVNNGGHLLPAYYDAWASRLANFAAVLQQSAGVPLYGVSVQNEPDYTASYNSAIYSPQEMVDFIKVLGPKLAALTPRPKLITPDAASWATFWDYSDAILSDPVAASYADILATHQYFGISTPHAIPSGKPLWQTEMSSFDGPSTDIGNGITVAKWIHDALVNASVSAWHYWWLIGQNSDNEGLLNTGGEVTKRLYTLGNFSKFIRPGFVRVGTAGGPSGVYVSAYKDPAANTLTIVAINDNGASVPLGVSLNGISAATVTPWVTSATENLVPNAPIAVAGGRFTMTLSPSSVTTFVSANQVLPSVTSVSPTSGPVGTAVTMSGANFGATRGTSTVTFNGTVATPTSWSAGSIGVPVPTGATTGNVVVTVGGVASNGVPFTVTTSGLPAPWVSQDVGTPGIAGQATYASGVFTVTGSGTDIFGTSDQFRFVYQTLDGDGEVVARVDSVETADPWTKAGVMIREDLAGDAPIAMAAVTAANGVMFQSRVSRGGTSTSATGFAGAAPQWIRLVRSGNTFSGYSSATGTSWTLMSSATVPMATHAYVGLAVTSHNAGVTATHTFSNVTVTAALPNRPPTLTQPANQTSAEGATVSLQLSASDPDGDALTYSATNLPVVLSVNTATGVISGTLSAGSAGSYSVTATVSDGSLSNSKTFAWTVTAVSQAPSLTSVSPTSGPVGTAVTTSGANFGATQGTSTVTFNGTAATPASWSAGSIVAPVPSGATTGNVVVTVGGVASNGVPFTVTTSGLPAPWVSQDVGSPAVAGQATYSAGTFTVTGAGVDIWDVTDEFQFVYQTLDGDGEIVARVASLQDTDGWAKAGVMIREDLTADAPNAVALVTPGNGMTFQSRTTRGDFSTSILGFPGGAPQWIRVVRTGSTFNGYTSADGVSWTLMGSFTITMATHAYIGLSVTSSNPSVTTDATFTDVNMTAYGTGLVILPNTAAASADAASAGPATVRPSTGEWERPRVETRHLSRPGIASEDETSTLDRCSCIQRGCASIVRRYIPSQRARCVPLSRSLLSVDGSPRRNAGLGSGPRVAPTSPRPINSFWLQVMTRA